MANAPYVKNHKHINLPFLNVYAVIINGCHIRKQQKNALTVTTLTGGFLLIKNLERNEKMKNCPNCEKIYPVIKSLYNFSIFENGEMLHPDRIRKLTKQILDTYGKETNETGN